MSSLPSTTFDDLDAWSVLRPQEIADRWRVDVRSVRRAIAAGVLPASRACGVRVLAADAARVCHCRLADGPADGGSPKAPRYCE
jgi:hypothetical protein